VSSRLFALLFLFLAVDAIAAPPTTADAHEIQYLIASIESLQGAQFIRNGTSYDAVSAASHLRLKLDNAGSRVRTADDFIRLCASVSSVSGRPYEIRFADGRTITSESFLKARLAELRMGSRPGE
jgi:hypothetical protein